MHSVNKLNTEVLSIKGLTVITSMENCIFIPAFSLTFRIAEISIYTQKYIYMYTYVYNAHIPTFVQRYKYIHKNEFNISYPERKLKGRKAHVKYLIGLVWVKVTDTKEPVRDKEKGK